jgi:hypothetical protein
MSELPERFLLGTYRPGEEHQPLGRGEAGRVRNAGSSASAQRYNVSQSTHEVPIEVLRSSARGERLLGQRHDGDDDG